MSKLKVDQISKATGASPAIFTLPAADGTSGQYMKTDGGGALSFGTPPDTGGLFSGYALFADQKTLGTDAGTFTSGSWQTRDLNTTLANTDTTNITLGTNEFTLLAGNYFIEWTAPAYDVQGNQTRLYDVTGTAEIESGTSSQSSVVDAHGGFARVTPSSSNAYRIEHKCLVTKATNGFGMASDFSTEKYLMVKIYKES